MIISCKNTKFKYIVSGPAQPYQIFNYIIDMCEKELKYVQRTKQVENAASSWAIDFMIGLDLCEYDSDTKVIFPTYKGKELYKLLKNYGSEFDEKSANKIVNDNDELKILMEDIFLDSDIYQVLVSYLEYRELVNVSIVRQNFIKDYYEFVYKLFRGDCPKDSDKKTSTASNRVPSLIQWCTMIGYCQKTSPEEIKFTVNDFNEEQTIPTITNLNIDFEKYKNSENYNEDGNVKVTRIVRDSTLQRIFRKNLVKEFGCCCLCGIDKYYVLNASHIKPAAECNAEEKCNSHNGLLLCKNHDALFDGHHISFDARDGSLMISDKIPKDDYQILGLDKDFRLKPYHLSDERKSFLKLHNEEFDKGNTKI